MIEFSEALAQLLRDERMREQFADNPSAALEGLALSNEDRKALLHLHSADIEMQAVVLLRKRFDEVRRVLTGTCSNLGDSAWPLFKKYASCHWPDGNDRWADARAFAVDIAEKSPGALNSAERNRMAFAVGTRRWAVAFARELPVAGRFRPAVQIFWRRKVEMWREVAIFFGL